MKKFLFLTVVGLGVAIYFSKDLSTARDTIETNGNAVKETATDTYNTASDKANQLTYAITKAATGCVAAAHAIADTVKGGAK